MASALPVGSVHPSKDNVNDNTSSKKVRIVSSFQDYAERATCHGVYYVVHDGWKLRRLIWLLVILGCAGYFLYTTIKLLAQYRARPVTTKNSVVEKRSILFPAVTICNFNKIRKSYAVHAQAEGNGSKKNGSEGSDSPVDINAFFRKYGHGMEEDGMLLACWWDGENCTSKDFSPTVEGMGLCHTFNSGLQRPAPRHTTDPGEVNGLRLTLNIQAYDYTGSAPAIGLKVRVHDQHALPMVTDLGFAVMPGRKAYVTVIKKEVINLPKPYGHDCLEVLPDHAHHKLEIGECWRNCVDEFVAKKCKCRMDSQSKTGTKLRLCHWKDYTECYDTIAGSLHVLVTQNCSCQKLCTQTSFETDISYALFNGIRDSPALLNVVYNTSGKRFMEWSNQSKEDFLRQNVLELSIFYQELSFDRNEDIAAYSFESFIAEAGGTMGLFLGASVLTVVEVLDLLCYILSILVSKKS